MRQETRVTWRASGKEPWTRARVGRSRAWACRYSLSDNGEGSSADWEQVGSKGQVELKWSFCRDESQLEGSKSRSGGPERESAGEAAAGASAGRISVDICISTQVNQTTRILETRRK